MLSYLSRARFSNIVLNKNTNQAQGIGAYAINFLKNGKPSPAVIERVKLFHTDSVVCGLSALALKTNAPSVLKNEALQNNRRFRSTKHKPGFAKTFGSSEQVLAEKAILANAAAVREWDSNGTVFGYNSTVESLRAGEFGHNDFYPVVMAAALQSATTKGSTVAKAMILVDEIRGRLCESFSLKTYKIDHVVHGAIASAATYGAMLGATADQIEYAIGMFCAHYIPFRAIRAGKQLSDSKGSSAAISTEAAILCIKRTMAGFIGPKDIFRNPEAIFRINEPTNGDSPFDIYLGMEGDDFAVMGMHFKLGLYEHQSAGAIDAIMRLLFQHRFDPNEIKNIKIVAYEPAFGIIGDPAKRSPSTRQSADHSMVYIISTLLRKASEIQNFRSREFNTAEDVWKVLMLEPVDYSHKAIHNTFSRALMEKMTFEHGGKTYDEKYPDGIPTSVVITLNDGTEMDSNLMMYPPGHARNTTANLKDLLNHKFRLLGGLALQPDQLAITLNSLNSLENLTNVELQKLYDVNITYKEKSIDDPTL